MSARDEAAERGDVPSATGPRKRGASGLRKPDWLKVRAPGGEGYARLLDLTRRLELNTVCQEARCPNIGECWRGPHATMTIMVLGDQCTRRCRFCAVETAAQGRPPDPAEPARVAEAIAALGVGYVVITSVDRDDLPDGGAAHYAQCIRAIRERSPQIFVEALIPDYGSADLATLLRAAPDVLAHNVEVVDRLQRKIRDPRCGFERSLDTLRGARALLPQVLTKSSLMLGLGESAGEIDDALLRLRAAGVDILTLGQYLRPSPRHAPVREYVRPERFAELAERGRALGFRYVAAGPLVRSSYRAGEILTTELLRARRGASITPSQNPSSAGASNG